VKEKEDTPTPCRRENGRKFLDLSYSPIMNYKTRACKEKNYASCFPQARRRRYSCWQEQATIKAGPCSCRHVDSGQQFNYRARFLYLGTIPPWYLRPHRPCDRLSQSCIDLSAGVPAGEPSKRKSLFYFTPDQQNLSGSITRGGGFMKNEQVTNFVKFSCKTYFISCFLLSSQFL